MSGKRKGFYSQGFATLFSPRTEEALAAKKAQRVVLGKPKGTIQSSMYDKDPERIQGLLLLDVPKKLIVQRHLGEGTTKRISYYIRTRKSRKQRTISKP